MPLPTLPTLPIIGTQAPPAAPPTSSTAFDLGGFDPFGGGGGFGPFDPFGGGGGGGTGILPFLESPTCINDPNLGINTCGSGGAGGVGGIAGLGSVILLPTGGVGVGTGTGAAASVGSGALGTLAAFGSSITGSLFGSSLLRIAFFLLGLIAIIGAIYLFKDTRPIVQGAVRTVRRVAQGAGEAA
jgi:hypothetical protein